MLAWCKAKVSTQCAAGVLDFFHEGEQDGEELVAFIPKTFAKQLAKRRVPDPSVAAQALLGARDAVLMEQRHQSDGHHNAGSIAAAASPRPAQLPHELSCPMTLELMRDPVICADGPFTHCSVCVLLLSKLFGEARLSVKAVMLVPLVETPLSCSLDYDWRDVRFCHRCAGHTYERGWIERWLLDHRTSPVTNARLKHTKLVPNIALRKIIETLAPARDSMQPEPEPALIRTT